MPLHIDRVETEIDLSPRPGRGESMPAGPARAPSEDVQLKERLRPLVLQILEEELERFTRRMG